MKKAKRKISGLLLLAILLCSMAIVFLLRPLPSGPKQRFVMVSSRKLSEQLAVMERKGVIRSARAVQLLGYATGYFGNRLIPPGVYEVKVGSSASETLKAITTPLRQLVRIPEGRWIARVAEVLEKNGVCTAKEYIKKAKDVTSYKAFGVPPDADSLEGFLYPDTYNFPPGLGADLVIKRQLLNFKKRTKQLPLTNDGVVRTLIIASMLELESADYEEKRLIAGVIENRVRKGMRLQIDATVNYGMQLWRPLFYADYTKVKSPFNTYLIKGLPPGPICSPTSESIKASLNPAVHNDLYYISMPDGVTLFSSTYEQHLMNIKKRDEMKKGAR